MNRERQLLVNKLKRKKNCR